MLRPERMSKVSVTGGKAVMPDVIETLHALKLLHLEEYDGSWEGFDPGRSMAGADEISEQLVTIRSIESILDLEREDVDELPSLTGVDVDDRIARIRQRVNDLDDERNELRTELRTVEDAFDRLEPYAALGLDLELYRGYQSLDVAVGQGAESEVRAALESDDRVRGFEIYAADDVVAIFAAPESGDAEGLLADVLVGTEFTAIDLPAESGDPVERRQELRQRRSVLENRLEGIEHDLESLRIEEGPFLIAVEESLSIDVEKREAPLVFATTERSFIVEGWVPTAKFETMAERLAATVGDRVVVEELESVDYNDDHHHDPGHMEEDGADDDDESQGSTTMHGDHPPVVQDNPKAAQPFELMVNLVSRPRYGELDPTIIVFLTFPLAFGFMIGDIGYGILYGLMGVAMLRFKNEALRALGWIAIWVGLFTALFGWFYDDIFGVHMSDMSLIEPIYPYFFGAGILDKGLQATEWAQLWLIVAILFGIVHLNVGFIIGFINDRAHGLKDATFHNISWILGLNGFFLWVFSTSEVGAFEIAGADITAPTVKPDFLVGTESVLAEFVGFTGLPGLVGALGLAMVLVGLGMVAVGEGIEGMVESPAYILGHSLSYLRMTAVLLAKGGMAFVVNVLVFGGYVREGGYVIFRLPGTDVSGLEADFAGLIWMDPFWVTIPVAILVFIFGHILVLLLGITAAGIQMTRLEWVEFFQKFYQGGGDVYEPYGARREAAEADA